MGAAASPFAAALQHHPWRGPCGAGTPLAKAVCETAQANGRSAPDLLAFYQARAALPLWVGPSGVKPEARLAISDMAGAARDGLEPKDYLTPGLNAALKSANARDPASLARAELALSAAFGAYAADLHHGRIARPLAYADPALYLRPITRRAVLEQVGGKPDLASGLRAAERVNPLYAALRDRLQAVRARWSGLPRIALPETPPPTPWALAQRLEALHRRLGLAPGGGFDRELVERLALFQSDHGLVATGRADWSTIQALNAPPQAWERRILVNLERARVLPPDPGRRFIVVDAAGQRLELYENGQARHEMEVAVGKPSEPTPEMAGLIRYAVFNPYWNVPPDLVRDGVAKKVLAGGPEALAAQRMEALADWSETAEVLDPAQIDWPAVARGDEILRVRQRPGPGNMMGRVKFMLPNPLGVYLHDTPKKLVFLAARRNVSAGCVRLQDALTLAQWLMPKTPAPAPGPDEVRVDIGPPVPVYILYLTVAPTPQGLAFHRDVYGRDRELIIRMTKSRARSA
jgi:murein L,D-transpeptidase YcbB/YkuD